VSREEVELVARHADQLVSRGSPTNGVMASSDRVQGLLDLAEQVNAILLPVTPNPNYRRRLHGELILEGQRLQLEPESNLLRQHRKGIIIGAAAVGSVASVVGVAVAVALRLRHVRTTNIAAS
jgi:hypothetical protein